MVALMPLPGAALGTIAGALIWVVRRDHNSSHQRRAARTVAPGSG